MTKIFVIHKWIVDGLKDKEFNRDNLISFFQKEQSITYSPKEKLVKVLLRAFDLLKLHRRDTVSSLLFNFTKTLENLN